MATFDPAYYPDLKRAEEHHFWFVVRRRWICDRLVAAAPPPATFLEVGCGTGNVGAHLSERGYSVTGCDDLRAGLEMGWPGLRRVQANAVELPFGAGAFDAVGLFDVIEHLDDDRAALAEAARVTADGGLVVVTVPARRELWSDFDVTSHHRRRYSPRQLKETALNARLRPVRVESIFAALYLPMFLTRQRQSQTQRSAFEVRPLVNRWAINWFESERYLSRFLPLPLGTSLLGVFRKI